MAAGYRSPSRRGRRLPSSSTITHDLRADAPAQAALAHEPAPTSPDDTKRSAASRTIRALSQQVARQPATAAAHSSGCRISQDENALRSLRLDPAVGSG